MNIIFIIDTNVLLSDGQALKHFGRSSVVIPFVVIDELDRHKGDTGETGLNARRTIKYLDSLRDLGSLTEGVYTPDGTYLWIQKRDTLATGDDYILETAEELQASLGQENLGSEVILVTNDLNLRIKADSSGIKAQKYDPGLWADTEDGLYDGIKVAQLDNSIVEALHKKEECSLEIGESIRPNEFLLARPLDESVKQVVARKHADGLFRKLTRKKEVFGVSSRNMEQACALDLLMDPKVPLNTLMGRAGSGKTLLAVAAALDLVMEQKIYDKIFVIRSPIPMGRDVGYLPGDLDAKMEVWAAPILDILDFLTDGKKYSADYLLEQGILEIGPATYLRGRTFSSVVVIVDEAQSLTRHEIKTIVTRMGEASKLILTGDVYQIDNLSLSATDNGFSYLVDRFKDEPLSGHVMLKKCERSDLAARAAELL